MTDGPSCRRRPAPPRGRRATRDEKSTPRAVFPARHDASPGAPAVDRGSHADAATRWPRDEHGKVVVPDLEEEYDWLDDINPDAKKTLTAFLEPGLGDAKPEDRFQFERHGYFVADLRESKPGKPVFNRTVTLRDSWTKEAKKG